MGKHRNSGRRKEDKLETTKSNMNAKNDYNKSSGEHVPKAVQNKEFERLLGKNPEQKSLINQIFSGGSVIVSGDAGTGKTFVCSVCAVDMLLSRHYTFKKIVLIRPNQPLGKSVGMLPGTALEKILPWIAPFLDGMEHRLSKQQLEGMLATGQIEVCLVEHLRGRTFTDAIILADEIQNLTVCAMKALLGRTGEGSKFMLTGDLNQTDLHPNEKSGLEYLYDVDDLATDLNIRKPYHHVSLIRNERSHEASFWCAMQKLLEEDNETQDSVLSLVNS